ncbi:unnamed protein product [Nippostrongylus brasiliensis]|uniref:Secreted protein n=1 Tax=Nippostrongylus brasiliensis TaxID=27835 RepID=A0A0N4YKM7_NIPBR|nr:unnamed protein product [Nippostrongylus brasiliensis]
MVRSSLWFIHLAKLGWTQSNYCHRVEEDALGESLDGWSWTGGDTNMSSCVATSDSWWSGGLSPFGASSRLDSLWAMDADPLGASNLSRFELQHLFPSQVLLQA